MCPICKIMSAFAAIALLATSARYSLAISLDEGPQAQSFANLGDTVIMVCDLRGIADRQVHWYQMESGRYLSVDRVIYRRLPDKLQARLSVLGDPAREQFNLRIQNLQLSDSGTYICQYAFPGGLATTMASSTLVVYIPPSPESPQCGLDTVPGVMSKIGDWLSLHCNSTGSPAALVIYRRGESQDVLARSVASVTLHWHLMPQDNGVDFTCTMISPALDAPRQCSVTPLKLFPKAEVTPSTLTTEEGANVSLTCKGFGVPGIASYRWQIQNTSNGRELLHGRYRVIRSNPFLDIASVRENITVTCFVTTPSGLAGSATGRVEVIAYSTRTTATLTNSISGPTNGDGTTGIATDSITASPSGGGSFGCPTTSQPLAMALPLTSIIAASSAILAALAILICICYLRNRKKRRKFLLSIIGFNNTPRSSNVDTYEDYLSITDAANKVDTLLEAQPDTNTEKTTPCPIYAVPDKPRRGVPRNIDQDQFLSSSGVPLKAVSRNRRRNAMKRRSLLQKPLEKPPTGKHDPANPPLCSQPKITFKNLKARLKLGPDRNGYDVVKMDETGTPSLDLTYADLAQGPPTGSDPSQEPMRKSTANEIEESIYAQIRTNSFRDNAPRLLNFDTVL